jgi:hypothetical protein
MALQRVRRLRAFRLRQTSQPQPIVGTPTLVPVPNRTICPRISVVKSSLGTLRYTMDSVPGMYFGLRISDRGLTALIRNPQSEIRNRSSLAGHRTT